MSSDEQKALEYVSSLYGTGSTHTFYPVIAQSFVAGRTSLRAEYAAKASESFDEWHSRRKILRAVIMPGEEWQAARLPLLAEIETFKDKLLESQLAFDEAEKEIEGLQMQLSENEIAHRNQLKDLERSYQVRLGEIAQLVTKNPNDMELGAKIRKIIRD